MNFYLLKCLCVCDYLFNQLLSRELVIVCRSKKNKKQKQKENLSFRCKMLVKLNS